MRRPRYWTRAWARRDATLIATAVALEPKLFRPSQLATFDLVFRQGLEYAEAGEQLGISYNAMRERVGTLRRRALDVVEWCRVSHKLSLLSGEAQ
jgi:hypothetical protein